MTSVGSPTARPRRPDWAGRNYSLLTASAVVTNLGSNGAMIAAAFAVLEAGGDAGDVGLVAAARTLPLVLFLLIGGAVADRLPRHHVMVAANALNCLSQAVFAVLVLVGEPQLWQMMLLTALGGTGQAFFSPAAEGMLLSSVKGDQAARAFAVFRMAMQSASMGGAALGGAMVAVLGPGWVLAVDALAFAVAGALRSFLDVSHIPAREPGGGMLADLREGWREFAGRSWLWVIVVQFAVANAVIGAAQSVYGPLVARDSLGGAGPWGLALATFGAGTVAGALLMTRWRPRRLLLAGTLCVFPLALPAAALAVPAPMAVLCAVMFATGVTQEVFGVSWMTALHQEIPEDKLSRVSAYDWFGSVALLPLATALAGPAEHAFGRTPALWGCAALIVVVTAAALSVRDVRNLTRHTRATPRDSAQEAPVKGELESTGG
ncbi:MFS transporter [Streptomyces turgidiscabies]|uniref:Transporter, major facilitator family protein n=1 Tax=Streptomyces turgidiscabies (strain Car8) TaxID=698760 RepID=L7F3H8_STRT8|nr:MULTISPECIES: MFS transporter [Streptomyces]ELP65165.1 transporter, major facilitator family protein [Streptomyces turgidiscabies Car8]MDX3494564.1 MFS transporter [Streptomyces turgidiscabies]GAQ71171.1 2-acyl-glycerophospho-ethanolamine acyltransferase [Streptomyces turgidiscabies]